MTNELLSTDSRSGTPASPRRKRRMVLRIILALILIAIVWALTSERPFAQGIQELLACKHDQTVIDKPFSVGPRTFRYYKFSLSPGSANVALVGQFAATGANNPGSPAGGADDGVEVDVFDESAFSLWQTGGAAAAVFESGRVTQGAIDQRLRGAGTYYLVFSNRFAQQTPKNVHASVLVRYPGWMPDIVRRTVGRFWGWFGL
jgi:hypothetical protein